MKGKIWAVRVMGGPTKIVVADSPLTWQKVERLYLKSFAYQSIKALDSGDDDAWPIKEVLSEEELQKKYSDLLVEHPTLGYPLALIRVENGGSEDGVPDVRGAGRADLRSGSGAGDGGSVSGVQNDGSRSRVRQSRAARREEGGVVGVPGDVEG